ncbi:MAG: hypothetical protein H0X04_00040 [Chthoniobacterales bacterium]|nr:hypothetical protein [Chthoniobacterales bacterium]
MFFVLGDINANLNAALYGSDGSNWITGQLTYTDIDGNLKAINKIEDTEIYRSAIGALLAGRALVFEWECVIDNTAGAAQEIEAYVGETGAGASTMVCKFSYIAIEEIA